MIHGRIKEREIEKVSDPLLDIRERPGIDGLERVGFQLPPFPHGIKDRF